jgi:hypothetical protein
MYCRDLVSMHIYTLIDQTNSGICFPSYAMPGMGIDLLGDHADQQHRMRCVSFTRPHTPLASSSSVRRLTTVIAFGVKLWHCLLLVLMIE